MTEIKIEIQAVKDESIIADKTFKGLEDQELFNFVDTFFEIYERVPSPAWKHIKVKITVVSEVLNQNVKTSYYHRITQDPAESFVMIIASLGFIKEHVEKLVSNFDLTRTEKA